MVRTVLSFLQISIKSERIKSEDSQVQVTSVNEITEIWGVKNRTGNKREHPLFSNYSYTLPSSSQPTNSTYQKALKKVNLLKLYLNVVRAKS